MKRKEEKVHKQTFSPPDDLRGFSKFYELPQSYSTHKTNEVQCEEAAASSQPRLVSIEKSENVGGYKSITKNEKLFL